jgi:hypothetical protein
MTPDPNSPETLLSVPGETEAAAIITDLAEYDIQAFAAGGYTSGFKTEAPGGVTVLVKHADIDRARQALAEIRAEYGRIDWSKVDVMETPEVQPAVDESVGEAPSWRAVHSHLWLTIWFLGIAVCLIVWLIGGGL